MLTERADLGMEQRKIIPLELRNYLVKNVES